MKKRIILTAIALALIAATIAGGSLAANKAETIAPLEAPLASSVLKVSIADKAEAQPMMLYSEAVLPGDSLLAEGAGAVSITNSGSLAEYGRVTITKYWATKDADGKLVKNTALDASQIQVTFNTANGEWLQAPQPLAGSGEQEVWYHSEPLAVGATTSALIQNIEIPKNLGGTDSEYAGSCIVVEVVADGVQFAGASQSKLNASGILASWGVAATLDASGNITSVSY